MESIRRILIGCSLNYAACEKIVDHVVPIVVSKNDNFTPFSGDMLTYTVRSIDYDHDAASSYSL